MDYNQIKLYFMAKEDVVLEHPYGEGVDVFKVRGRKVGVLTSDKDVVNVFVKCNPDSALALRDRYHSIVPGYQFDYIKWNALIIDGALPDTLIKEQIDHSFELIIDSKKVIQKV